MDPFIGQVVMFGGNFAPRAWAFCEGQLLAISSHSALFSILGTIYGGDGRTTFALPDLRGRIAIAPGNGPGLPSYRLGQRGGNYVSQLLTQNLPAAQATLPSTGLEANSPDPQGGTVGVPTGDQIDFKQSANGAMQSASIVGAQNTQFSNQDPYQAVNYIIALQGTYPSRN